MTFNFNPNLNSSNPIQGPQGAGYIPPATDDTQEDVHDPLASTISQSDAEALMVQFLMGWPILQLPSNNDQNSSDTQTASPTVEGITALYGAKIAQIGSEMWDKYIDNLAEEKQRIQEYLNSPAYLSYIQDRTLQGKVDQELNANIDTKTAIYNGSDFQALYQAHVLDATRLWGNTIDAVSNYVQDNKETNPATCSFLVASLAITGTYIGNLTNIVDVASTNMVTVTPIQDAVSSVLPMVPQQLQDQFTLVINLFAIGLINFSNAEAIAKNQDGKAQMTWESAVAFAKNILDNLEGNVINGFLMAMLVNKMDSTASTQEERQAQLKKLVVLAKAVMITAAVGALLKGATPDLRINALMFQSTMEGSLVAQSEDDQKLINELKPLVSYFNELKESGALSEAEWQNLTDSLGGFFDSNPDFEDFFSPSVLWAKLSENILNSDIEG